MREIRFTGRFKRDYNPDLILIYRKPDNENLDLVRLGSHSELGL